MKAALELKLWRWQRISALILLPLVAFHLFYQYFVLGLNGVTFGTVSAKLGSATLLIVDALLLITALTHGLLGLRAIVMDYARSAAFARTMTAVALAVLAAAILYGLAALLAFR